MFYDRKILKQGNIYILNVIWTWAPVKGTGYQLLTRALDTAYGLKVFFSICRSHIPQSPIFCRPAGSWSTLFVQCLKSLLRIGRRSWILPGTELRGRDSVDAHEGSWSIWYAKVYLVHSAGSDAVQTRYAKATGQFEITSCNLLLNSEMIDPRNYFSL